MPRTIRTHYVNECNDALWITAEGEPGCGGANHYYEIRHTETDPSKSFVTGLHFQDGAIAEVGTNGITHESLLAVLIDRLEAFQRGKFQCPENARALLSLRHALEALNERTRKRQMRGVEGTLTV